MTGSPETDNLAVKMAGIEFISPVGVAPIGVTWGKGRHSEPKEYAETLAKFALANARAGAGYIYINGFYASADTVRKLQELESCSSPRGGSASSHRISKRIMPFRDQGKDCADWSGAYHVSSPFILGLDSFQQTIETRVRMIDIVKKKAPANVRIIATIMGLGDLPDSFVDGAKKYEELGADLIELNLSCPGPATVRGAIEAYSEKRFSPYMHGSLIGCHIDAVERITREVSRAVRVPVGVKISPEMGFPMVVDLARRIRDAGAKFVTAVNSAIGIAPPDIHNHGKPLWPYLDGNPFCFASGAWMRPITYRDVAAIAQYVPGIDIAAVGGLVEPHHCVEAMMLGASLTQLCTGFLQKGRGLVRESNKYMRHFLADNGYQGAQEIVGLGQHYIKYNDDLDMMTGRVIATTDYEKCTKCGRCLNTICTARYSDRGVISVNPDLCDGCGGCTFSCEASAAILVER